MVFWARVLIDCSDASVVLWDDYSKTFAQGASTNQNDVAGRVRQEGGTSRWIVENCKPMVVHESEKDPHGPNPMLMESHIQSFIGMPIISKGRAIAVLYGLCTQHRKFDQGEADILRMLANLSAVAIANAELMRQANRLHEQRKILMRLVAHDLLNPLTNIQGFLELITLDFGPFSEQHEQWLTVIQQSATHMHELIKEVARYEQIVSQSEMLPKNVDLTSICLDVIREFKPTIKEKQIQIVPPASDTEAEVLGNPTMLKEVVHNLISNAIKYSHRRGRRFPSSSPPAQPRSAWPSRTTASASPLPTSP